ncbi:hypothetical protein ACFE04_017605 [Oxalis oulophora]
MANEMKRHNSTQGTTQVKQHYMANEMKVEILNRETIKPSSSTPHHLCEFKLTLLDQLNLDTYVSLLLFYPAKSDNDLVNIAKRLKSSLSETLTRFYPYAGRFKDGTSIDCNDEGVVFVEAKVSKAMSDVLKKPDFFVLKKFLSGDHDVSKEAARGPLLQVQANFFQCGGLAIGLSMSHQLTDAYTLELFVNSWAATASRSDVTKTFADFSMSSILPPMDPASVPHPFEGREGQFTINRYMFDESKLALLKAKAVSQGVENPTRVECVNGLIWKCAMAASKARFGDERESMFIQPVNLRKRFVPPLPENSIGNIFTAALADIKDTEIELHGFITNIRRGVQDAMKTAADGFKAEGNGLASLICELAKEMENMGKRPDMDSYLSTSWCRFPFYEADFGWGKPTWIFPSLKPLKNFFILMDARDGAGIEAWCSLLDEDTTLLECNQEFLAFAAINPSISY